MAEPKVRFRQDNGAPYPALRNAAMGDYYIERNERGEKGLPMLTVSIHSGISDGELDEEELGKRVNRSADVTLYKKAVKGDLVFNMMRAWQGAVGSTKCTGMVSPAYIVASPNEEIDPAFMNYYVQTKTIITRFNRLSYGALDFRKRLYWDSFVATEVNMPVIEEQQKIADFLSSVDEVIAASEQEVANLETQKKAVMKKIFSQEVRFKRADGSDFPEWEEKSIADLGEIIGGGTPKTSVEDYWNGDTPWISSADLEENNIHVVNITRYITDDAIDNSATKRIPKDAILIISRVGVGKVAVTPCELCTSQDYMSVVPYAGNIVFLGYAISKLMQDKTANVQGTSIKGIPSDEIKAYTIGISCLEEQHLIADFLSNFDEAIAAAKKELELWKELKKGLLQQMFV